VTGAARSVPEIVIIFPPAVEPLMGLIPLTEYIAKLALPQKNQRRVTKNQIFFLIVNMIKE
jgi:hypothetical protein